MHTVDDTPSGWIRPVATPTRAELEIRANELQRELAEVQAQLKAIKEDERLEAVVKIRNLMRGWQLSVEDLGLVPATTRRGRPRTRSIPQP